MRFLVRHVLLQSSAGSGHTPSLPSDIFVDGTYTFSVETESSSPLTYLWNVGTGAVLLTDPSLPAANVRFDVVGSVTISVLVTNELGESVVLSWNIYVLPPDGYRPGLRFRDARNSQYCTLWG